MSADFESNAAFLKQYMRRSKNAKGFVGHRWGRWEAPFFGEVNG